MARLIPMSLAELPPQNYRLELSLPIRPESEPGIIFHIPHASTIICPADRAGIMLDDHDLQRELLKLTDWYVHDILRPVYGPRDRIVLFPLSRLVVDVERFRDEADEPMARHGMGAVYNRTTDGLVLRADADGGAARRNELLLRHYDPHHRMLAQTVQMSLDGQGAALVLDCHSFPSKPLPCDLDRTRGRPEVCIGTDAFHTPDWLKECLVSVFRDEGLSVALNRPFAGTMVPLEYWIKNPRVFSAMIELRRDLYMDETTGQPMNLLAMSRVMRLATETAREAFARLLLPLTASGKESRNTAQMKMEVDHVV